MWSKFLCGVDGDIIVVSGRLSGRCICASCFGLVSSINYTFPSWTNFGFLSLDHFLLQTFSFRILMPNRNHHHHHHRQLNPHMHAMIPCFRSFIQQEEFLRISIMNLINLIRSHRFRFFHHYLFRAQPHALMAIDTTCSSDVISSFDDDNNNIDDVGSETEERELKRPNTH